MQELTQLKYIEFNWPAEGKGFWGYFKPQPSLEYLTMTFHTHHWMNDKLFAEDQAKDVVAHWEDLKELKGLEFNLSAENPEEFNLVRMFITRVLKKVQKLKALKFWIGTSLAEEHFQETYEPFLVADVPHLYESLEKFEYQFYSWTEGQFTKFDLGILKPFRNLKSLKLEGNIVSSDENFEEIVSLLAKGEFPVLEFNLKRSLDSPADWLRNTLKVLEKKKKTDKNLGLSHGKVFFSFVNESTTKVLICQANDSDTKENAHSRAITKAGLCHGKELKILIDLEFGLKDYMEILERLCSGIQSVKTIKGLKICLNFNEDYDHSRFPKEKVKEVLNRYSGVRNLKVVLLNRAETLELIRVDGEKEQLFVDPYVSYTF